MGHCAVRPFQRGKFTPLPGRESNWRLLGESHSRVRLPDRIHMSSMPNIEYFTSYYMVKPGESLLPPVLIVGDTYNGSSGCVSRDIMDAHLGVVDTILRTMREIESNPVRMQEESERIYETIMGVAPEVSVPSKTLMHIALRVVHARGYVASGNSVPNRMLNNAKFTADDLHRKMMRISADLRIGHLLDRILGRPCSQVVYTNTLRLLQSICRMGGSSYVWNDGIGLPIPKGARPCILRPITSIDMEGEYGITWPQVREVEPDNWVPPVDPKAHQPVVDFCVKKSRVRAAGAVSRASLQAQWRDDGGKLVVVKAHDEMAHDGSTVHHKEYSYYVAPSNWSRVDGKWVRNGEPK